MVSTASIVSVLEDATYVRRGDEIVLGKLGLRFGEVLTGPGEGAGLVCVENVSESSWEDLWRRVRSLLLGLESVGSQRHVTLVVLGPPEDADRRFRLSSMVRMRWVPATADKQDVPGMLQPLLPLKLPAPVPDARAGAQELRTRLTSVDGDLEALMESARDGSDAVRGCFVERVERLAGVDDEATE